MSTLRTEKQIKAKDRSNAIKAQLVEYYESVRVLQSVLDEINSKGPKFDASGILPKSTHMFQFTIKNLNEQIYKLQWELGILNEYCLLEAADGK